MNFDNLVKPIDNLVKPVDNLFDKLNNNKPILLLLLALLAIYSSSYVNSYVNSLSDNFVDLFDNNIFKFIIFMIITYITTFSPALGISLTIAILVTLQVITNLKLKKNLSNEKFSTMMPMDMSYNNNNYLTNPLLMQKDLSPPVNLNLHLENPKNIYNNMLKKGKILLEDSLELEKDLLKRPDIRETKIAEITRRNGLELVSSGLNRLQQSNNGEYNFNNNTKYIKFVKYNKLIESNSNNPLIMLSFQELQNNFNKLLSTQSNKKLFDAQLEKVYQSEFELLELVYKYKKDNFNIDEQKKIEQNINEIKQLKNENKSWTNKLIILSNILS